MIPRPSYRTEDQHNDIEDTHICEMTPDLLIFGGNVSVFLCIMETDICPDRHHETRDDQQEDGYLVVIVEDRDITVNIVSCGHFVLSFTQCLLSKLSYQISRKFDKILPRIIKKLYLIIYR